MTEKLIRNEKEAIDCLRKNKPTSGYYMLQESVEMAIQALEEIQQYRAIGTIELFRELTEKAEPKKPILIGYRKDGEAVHECGCCGATLTYADQPFCMNCSCKVDWE